MCSPALQPEDLLQMTDSSIRSISLQDIQAILKFAPQSVRKRVMRHRRKAKNRESARVAQSNLRQKVFDLQRLVQRQEIELAALREYLRSDHE